MPSQEDSGTPDPSQTGPPAGAWEASSLSSIEGIELAADASLAPLTTLRIGGPADRILTVHSEAALAAVLRQSKADGQPWVLLGLGSNVLVPDDGLRCTVLRLAGALREVRVDGCRVEVGAALPLPQLAQRMSAAGLVGLEALSGFPSTVGGAVCMNAGCYGTEIVDVLVSVRVVDGDGEVREMAVEELDAGYRSTTLQGSDCIVTSATMELRCGDAEAAVERIRELNRRRWQSLPSGFPNAGSIFRNPPGDAAGRLIDAAGLKGRRAGGAQISERHANVIVNRDAARADHVMELMGLAYREVRSRFAVELEAEIVLLGDLAARWRSDIASDAAS